LPRPQAPSQSVPPEFAKTVSAIGIAAGILGLFCLYDALREALGAYQYHNPIPALGIYKGVLGIYTAARQGHQWSDPDAKPSLGGRFFVLAWLAVPVLLNALEVGRLWFPPPIQPADLNTTLNWVIGYYVFGKASAVARVNGLRPFGLGKTLDARRAARGLLAQAPLPEEKIKMMETLNLAVEVLGAVCLFDVLREAISPPNQSAIDVHFAYKLALSAYAGTNHWRKWTQDGPEPDTLKWGGLWVGAWVAAFALIKGLAAIDSSNIIVLPTHLTGTLLFVCSIYALGRGSDVIRKSRRNTPGPRPRPAPTPAPVGDAPPADTGMDLSKIQQDILAALEGEPDGLTIAEIGAKVSKDKNNTRRPLNELVDAGVVVKIAAYPTDPNTRYKLAKYA
jgi:hypothetical protein